ncbi:MULTISPECIES: YceI family protein [unclassified Modestobacter]|uniref:YceI family protein n=1 Tax=unclassified Modestobacter TaxID=2643866 RepID=UPI0022A9F73C|nr:MULTISPECIES: YceI family protein [unclassified Modestobacter]MCZ2825510.1 YceI family protein [Modestobacter sp. VKM Ac-2981]MCZ2853425.1 YceI family protein [Modestobacter sp. VKM Ac-2982]
MPSRRTWWITGGAVAVVAAGALGGPLIYAALAEDAPPAETVQAQPQEVELAADTDGTWTIAPDSTAGYRVDEVLNGADVTVAGTTDQVTGTVVVSGGDLADADVTVDVASISTDSGRRDSYFRDNVMDVAANPTAVFSVTEVADLPQLSGTPVTVPVTGELTLAGTTQPVTTELSVVRTADGVDVSGAVPVTFADYGIEPPDLGFVSVEDQGSIEFFLRLTM